jgi:hypothetical protein
VTAISPPTTAVARSAVRTQAIAKRWSWPHYLALIGAPVLVLQVWTIVAWIADDAHQVTQFRTPHSVSWWAARAYEGVGILIFVGVGQQVLRQCLREKRLTFDGMFLLTGMTMFWSDLGINAFGPAYLMSSNFVNLNNPLGHLPGMVNPDIGRAPDPLLFTIPLESAGVLLGAWLIGWLAGRLRARNPELSTPKLLLRLFGIGLLLDLVLEVPIVALGLWTYPAPSWSAIPLGSHGSLYPAFEWLSGGMVFLFAGALRLFRNDRGQTIVERGLDHLPRTRAGAISLLATYACIQLIAWGPPTWIDLAYVPYETQWHQTPQYLLNDACDAPGVTGTRFGPCPGSPGYRMPGRGSLPGPNP